MAQGKLIVSLSLASADLDHGIGGERVFRHLEIGRRRTFADAARGVVVRPVARAEVTAELALDLALGGTKRHSFKPITTRRYHSGEHLVQLQRVAEEAEQNSMLYGLFAVGLSLLMGWLAGRVFALV